MNSPDHLWHDLRRLHDSPELFERIANASDVAELKLQRQLRADYPPELVRLAMQIAELREKAAAKFSMPQRMWFDAVALEQATSEVVAKHKAERFRNAGCEPVMDLCCGIGADAIALADHANVIAIDSDLARCLMTKWNAEACNVADRVQPVCADVTTLIPQSQLVHIDPDRRGATGKRSRRVEQMQPSLEFLHELMRTNKGGAIKLSPAANFGGNFHDVEFELVSLNGECKECTVWFGQLRSAKLISHEADVQWRATVLPSGETITGDPLDAMPEFGPLHRYLYEPDPAVVRAGLVDLLADRFGLFRLDDDEEYLTGDARIDSPFLSVFEAHDELPNNERTIRRYFRERTFGSVEIKSRRIPVKVEDLRRKLPLADGEMATIIFARIGGKSRVVIATRL